MGSVGNTMSRPKYSNEQGVIMESTVKADSRYNQLHDIFEEFKHPARNYDTGRTELVGAGYLAGDFLRNIMKMEENGETNGSIHVDIWNEESLKDKMAAYKKALKAVGYKVTKQENKDMHRRGYATARGGRVYASTHRARTLYFEKVKK